MSSALENAIARVRSAGDRTCETQVYYFDDYDPTTGDATALCKRLGIPFTDEIVIEFSIKRTFNPLPVSRIKSLSNQLEASLPKDYSSLLSICQEVQTPVSTRQNR